MWKIIIVSFLVTQTLAGELPTGKEVPMVSPLDGRIVGGKDASITQFPYQISLRNKECETCAYTHDCGGSIFNANIIVTAAHCVQSRTASDLIVVAGTDFNSGSDGAVALVAKIIMHEQYEPFFANYDIALLFLATPLPLNGYSIAPVPLATQVPNNGAMAVVSGWGSTSEGSAFSLRLQEVELPIISTEMCKKAYGGGLIKNNMLCAGIAPGAKDSCQGDSGGPLVSGGQLVGVVSWGNGCGKPGYPGVYANVAYFNNWIQSTISKNF